jgi:hypothetical protein
MIKIFLMLFCLFFFWGSSSAQDKKPFVPKKMNYSTTQAFHITAGYVPKASINALKATFAFNDFFLRRIGAYTSMEKGLNSDFFTNIFGITGSLHKNIYMWGGVEFFTKNGLLNNDINGLDKVRKEFGVGIILIENLLIKGGWSQSVGPTFGAGVRIPI